MSITRRGFFGLVAGALAACKLAKPVEAASPPRSKQEAMDAYLRDKCGHMRVKRLQGGTPISAEHQIADMHKHYTWTDEEVELNPESRLETYQRLKRAKEQRMWEQWVEHMEKLHEPIEGLS